MARKLPLPFDPIEEAARQWGTRWAGVAQMRAVTSLMRVQQLVLAELDELLRPHGLTFARYEALVLLTFSRAGALPLGKMGDRLQVHPTSITSIIDRLEAAGHVVRTAAPHGRPHRAWPRSRTSGGRSRRRPPPTSSRPISGSARSTSRAWPRWPACSSPCGGRPGTSREVGLVGRPTIFWRHSMAAHEHADGRSRWAERYAASRVRDADFTTLSGLGGRARLRPGRGRGAAELRPDRLAGRVPVHPRSLRHRLPRPHLDDPAVRRASATPSRPTSATR